MLSKNNIKFINSLRQKKYRQIHHHFFVEGEKMVKEALRSGFNIQQIIATENGLKSFNEELLNKQQLIIADEKELKKISSFTTASNIFAVIEIPNTELKKNIEKEICIGIEEINDPGNLGTIIRIADWFGIKTIYCSTNSVDVYNPKVVQATMGAIFRVNVIYCNLEEIVNIYKSKLKVYGTFMMGNNLFQEKLSNEGLILFGNESKGLSKKLESLVDYKITIPNFSKENVKTESLNISSAVAIVCAQFRNK